MSSNLPEEKAAILKKGNRIKKLSPKTHTIVHESGRSTKMIWRKIVERAKKEKYVRNF